MKRYLNVLAAIVALCMVPFLCKAQSVTWTAADHGSPILIKYVGTGAATSVVTTLKLTLFDGAVSNSTALYGHTVDALIDHIDAYTNASGEKTFRALRWSAIGTEVSSNLVPSAATALTVGTWYTNLTWDTTKVDFYDVVPSIRIGDEPFGGYYVQRLVGEPTGTGNVTVAIYDGNDQVYSKTVVSPTYALPSSFKAYTNTITQTRNDVVNLDDAVNLGTGIRIGQGHRGLIRVTRATAATSGAIGAICEPASR